ncbi:MAG: squalene synthase HpnD [Candidatus Omnitrophota bacterium]|jgi:phytoene synthase|nr:MAG: squalene synthase HpnD [Candidatus Omnitrophota bacterium]
MMQGKSSVNDYHYTRAKTKDSKTNFYYSFLFLPKKKREAIFTIYSFCRHTDDIVDENKDPIEARRQLDEWRKELDACYEHRPSHPITHALHRVSENFPIPKDYLHDLIDGMEMDLTCKRYPTFTELETYCYRAASVVGLICIEIFGYSSPHTKEYAISLGKALQLTNIMRDVAEDARIDRIYIPQDEIERFGYSEKDIFSGTYSPAFVELMQFQAERAQVFFDRALELYEKRDHHLLFPAEIMRKIYYRLYQKIVEANYDVFSNRICISNKKKLRIALKEWLGSRWRRVTRWNPAS